MRRDPNRSSLSDRCGEWRNRSYFYCAGTSEIWGRKNTISDRVTHSWFWEYERTISSFTQPTLSRVPLSKMILLERVGRGCRIVVQTRY